MSKFEITRKAKAEKAKNKANEINKANNGMEAFLEKRKLQIETIAKVKAENKTRARSGIRKLGKENYLLLAIYNANTIGVTYEELVAHGAERVDPESGLKEWESATTGKMVEAAVSEITVNHNWNVEGAAVQRGELKLRDPQALTKKVLKTEPIGEIYFEIETENETVSKTNPHKNNNRITLCYGQEILKAYLLKQGAKENTFVDYVEPKIPENKPENYEVVLEETSK